MAAARPKQRRGKVAKKTHESNQEVESSRMASGLERVRVAVGEISEER
jgi:hypothetical protein